jgi:hypothetical protein
MHVQAGTTVSAGVDFFMGTITAGFKAGLISMMVHLVAGSTHDLSGFQTVNLLICLVDCNYPEVAIDHYERSLMGIDERLKTDVVINIQQIGRHCAAPFALCADSSPVRHDKP